MLRRRTPSTPVTAAVRVPPSACRRLSAAGSFAVSVLTERQQWISTLFARSQRPAGYAAMRRLGAVEGVTGNAVVPSAVTFFECRLENEHPGGDHVMFVGRVVALRRGEPAHRPLLFHRGRYATLA